MYTLILELKAFNTCILLCYLLCSFNLTKIQRYIMTHEDMAPQLNFAWHPQPQTTNYRSGLQQVWNSIIISCFQAQYVIVDYLHALVTLCWLSALHTVDVILMLDWKCVSLKHACHIFKCFMPFPLETKPMHDKLTYSIPYLIYSSYMPLKYTCQMASYDFYAKIFQKTCEQISDVY